MSRPTAADKRHFARVVALGCIVCGSPAQIHHVKAGLGMGQRDHSKVLPLCLEHHTGNKGFHTNKKMFEEINGTENELLAKLIVLSA
jgi:hypothetical protein